MIYLVGSDRYDVLPDTITEGGGLFRRTLVVLSRRQKILSRDDEKELFD